MRCWHKAAERRDREAAPGQPLLTLEDYIAVGGATAALSQHAQEVINILGPDLASTAKIVFQALTDVDREARVIRRPQRLSRLARLVTVDGSDRKEKRAAKANLVRVVGRFADPDCSFLRHLRTDEDPSDPVIDIGHEALIRRWDKLKGEGQTDWVREEREDGERYRDLLRAVAARRPLWPHELLTYRPWWRRRRPNRHWAQRYTPNGTDQFFKVRNLLRRSSVVALLFAAAPVILLLSGAYYLTERTRIAEQEQRQAEERLRKDRALLTALRVDEAFRSEAPALALRLASDALDPTSGVQYIPRLEALAYRALQSPLEKQIISVSEPPLANYLSSVHTEWPRNRRFQRKDGSYRS